MESSMIGLKATDKLKANAPLRDYLLDCLLNFSVRAGKILDSDVSPEMKVAALKALRKRFGKREDWKKLGLPE